MIEQIGNCWNCSQALNQLDFGRQESCAGCGKDTRVCKNCIHYDRSFNNECRESQADRVVEKEKSCFCDYFSAKTQQGLGAKSLDSMKSAAESLFKKKVSRKDAPYD